MRRIRILQVVGRMNRGGVETWLKDLQCQLDRNLFSFDFLVQNTEPGDYDKEVLSRGARILVCPRPRNFLQHYKRLKGILSENGPYDVIHSHVHLFSGLVLRAASEVGVSVRIAHSHTERSGLGERAGVRRWLYTWFMRRNIWRHATIGLAVSNNAAAALWGPDWHLDRRWRLLHCAIDLTPFTVPGDKVSTRESLGIPRNAFVLGHVGSLSPPKNHQFLVRIAAEAMRSDSNVWLLLVGQGPLRSQIEKQICAEGISPRVVLAGARNDVPRLLLGAMDVFVFPSLYEGLPLAVIEAQAAGLPIAISNSVYTGVQVVDGLIRWLPLSDPASRWAEVCLESRERGVCISRGDCYRAVKESSFNIQRNAETMETIYSSKPNRKVS